MKNILSLIFFTASCFLHAQQAVITGTVTSGGEPLPYAHVFIKSIDKGTTADEEGFYELQQIPDGRISLTVSAVGYETLTTSFYVTGTDHITADFTLDAVADKLEEVVIMDELTGLTRRSPYNISGISLRGIENKGNPLGVMGLLKEVPGVYGAEFGHGIVKPFIRGLGFSRIVTIFQGNKLENHQWGADHGLGINDLGVSRVDVIKGPASVLYGSGALGGVLVVKDDESYLHSKGLTGNIGTTFNTVSRGIRSYASAGKVLEKDVFLAADAAWENHGDYNNGNERIIGNSRFNTSTIRLHSGIEKENFQNKLSFTYNRQNLGIISDDEMEDEKSLATTRNDREMQLPFQEVTDHLLSYNQTAIHRQIETSLHLSHHINLRREIESQRDQTDLGLKQHHSFYNARIGFNGGNLGHNLGIQGSLIRTRNLPEAKDLLIPDADTFENGIYYLMDLDWNSFFFQGAIRYDYRKMTADAGSENFMANNFILPGEPENKKLTRTFGGFTGSLGATKNFNKENILKVNVSTGFRAPDLAELFSNGPHPGTSRFEMGNDRFTREQSIQADVSYLYTSERFQGMVSLFGSRLDNYIFFSGTGEIRPIDGLEIWKFQQTNAAFYGAEFELSHSWLAENKLETKISGALVRGQEIATGEPLNFIPPDHINAEVGYYALPNRSLHLFTKVRLVNEQMRTGINEETTAGYNLINMGVSKIFWWNGTSVDTGLTVYNVLNRTYTDHMSILRAFEVSSPGRNFMLNLKLGF